ncbi:unnamed protein product [Pedinophyceae sp. YPF-701]|nr:unnamed protein product [Pedinophyceae sp. YPF-701]
MNVPSDVSVSVSVTLVGRRRRILQAATYAIVATFEAQRESSAASTRSSASSSIMSSQAELEAVLSSSTGRVAAVQELSMSGVEPAGSGTSGSAASPPSGSSGSSGSSGMVIVAAAGAVGGVVLIVVGAVGFVIVRRRRRSAESELRLEPGNALRSLTVEFETLRTRSRARSPGQGPQVQGTLRENMWVTLRSNNPGATVNVTRSDVRKIVAGRQVVGSGSYGTVYKGKVRGRDVAVKCITDLQGQPDPAAYKKEVEALQRLRHPHILAMYASFDEECAIVSPFYAKGSLRQALHDSAFGNDPLPWRTRVRILADISSAVLSMHSDRPDDPVIHRDLKPANILLTDNLDAVVADLGCARINQGSIFEGPKGTVGYADPEYVRLGACSPMDTHLDVYSLGVIILEMLTNKAGSPGADRERGAVFNGKHIRDVVSDALTGQQSGGGLRSGLFELLDHSAGDWGGHQCVEVATMLAELGLKCSDPVASQRPEVADIHQRLRHLLAATTPRSLRDTTLTSQDDILRAFENDVKDFICPISLFVPEDPVRASDGRVYERNCIESHFNACRGRGLPLTSPITRERVGQDLVPQPHRTEEFARFVEGVRSRLNDAGKRRLQAVLGNYQ